ncbi:hypothetical protein RIF29_38791 [Crotalaria pallida]|uniref:Uncharacterized protein n=1 Tax=Crotalaria pallida TaxID=3830 RepID=A0AAN9HP94_CROPI
MKLVYSMDFAYIPFSFNVESFLLHKMAYKRFIISPLLYPWIVVFKFSQLQLQVDSALSEFLQEIKNSSVRLLLMFCIFDTLLKGYSTLYSMDINDFSDLFQT